MECPRCSFMNASQARFCAHCGYSLVKSQLCRHCYSLIAPADRFCSHCGNRVIENINDGSTVEPPDAITKKFYTVDKMVETRETLPVSPALTMETAAVRVTSEQPEIPPNTATDEQDLEKSETPDGEPPAEE